MLFLSRQNGQNSRRGIFVIFREWLWERVSINVFLVKA